MKLIQKEVNVLTGEETITEREETAVEIKAREAEEKEIAKRQAEAEVRATARQSILDRIGLTADEAKLLLG
jgi:hypothetical protein